MRKVTNGKALAPALELSVALAFAGGYGDACGYLLAGSFTGHVTGNTVLAATALASGDVHAALTHAMAIACFLATTGLALFISHEPEGDRTSIFFLLCTEWLLVLVAPVALIGHHRGGPEALIVCLCLALGLQNGVFRKMGGIGVHTSYITGDLTTLLSALFGAPSQDAKERERRLHTVHLVVSTWLGFVAGALCATSAVHFLAASATYLLIVPLAVCFLLLRGSQGVTP